MTGNGIDMYDLIVDLHNPDDFRLTKISEHIWIGVMATINPSPPVPRRRTRCFSKCPVYFFKGRRVFRMRNADSPNSYDYYYIPDEELHFVEKDKIRLDTNG